MSENNSQYRFDSVDLVLYLWNKRLPLIVLTGLAAIVSVIASLLIENKYKSEVIVFPTATGSVSQDLLSLNNAKKNILNLGEEEEVEQLLQVLHSDVIRQKIITKYNLKSHYDVKESNKYPLTTLNKKFAKNISFKPTKFMSISITVMDKDPNIAAAIANDIAAMADTVMNQMQKERANQALLLVEQQYRELTQSIQTIQDSLTVIRSLGVVDYESQAEVLNNAYGQAILAGKTEAAKTIEKKLAIVAKYGGAYVAMRDFLEFQSEQLSDLKAKYAEAKLDASQFLPKKYVVNSAVPSERKDYPRRSIIVIVSTLSAFVMSVLLLVVFDVFKARLTNLKQNLK